ncbi:MAG TPA: type VI secretion system tube protein Hcp [Bryobacteraceae bacterium]|jgi:type VI secretion system secreted protein Hcp|nr:type VI secretion system tube protein Hcp [Bryobacteraceae bacterium]
MAVEIFLKIDGVTGESKANGHAGEIEVFSFSLGASNPSSVAYGHGSGAGKVDISSLSIQKQVDNASAKLFQNCASGKHFGTGTLVVREAGGDKPVEYYKLEMAECFIDSVSWGGSAGGGKPSESVAMSFSSLKITYFPQNEDGSQGTQQQGSWDIKKNTPA